jgi:hypothetical protein
MNKPQSKFRVSVVAATAVFAGIMSGCTTSTPRSRHASEPTEIPIEFRNTSGSEVPIDARPGDLALLLGSIPGSILGRSTDSLQVVNIGRQQSVQVDLDDLAAKLSNQATKLGRPAATTLQITPRDARFARVATGVIATKGAYTGLVGFKDLQTREALTLLYFDRPCRLTGTSVSQSRPGREAVTTEYNIDVESPGLVWMVTKHDRASHTMNVRAEMPRPVIVASPLKAPGSSESTW